MARLRVGLKTEKLEEEIGKCLEKGEKAGGGACRPRKWPGSSKPFKPLLCGGG